MALSFAAGSWQLVNWGFSTGDIALLAGAGRTIGTWLMAEAKDRSLIDFMSIDVDTILTRRGLVDTMALHKRWDKRLRLLKNGRPFELEHPAGKKNEVIENVGRFTWIMILIVAALDTSMGSVCLERTMMGFIETLLQESPMGTEYIHREIRQHIQGWRSSACVRGLLRKANGAWAMLEKAGKHWPGTIPEGDCKEVQEMLLWITKGNTTTFATTSSDAYCVAAVLQELGLAIEAVENERADEHGTFVHLHAALATEQWNAMSERDRELKLADRFGMRIPLTFMQESVSLWPGGTDQNNLLRQRFEDGMHAVEHDQISFKHYLEGTRDSEEWVYSYCWDQSADTSRLGSMEHRVARLFLPWPTKDATKQLFLSVTRLPIDVRAKFESWIEDPQPDFSALTKALSNTYLADIQSFLLGFYYRLLRPLLQHSHLSVPEAFGSWTYNDVNFLRFISTFGDRGGLGKFRSHDILSLLAYLFAGADHLAIEQIANSSTTGRVTGILSKLSLLANTMIGSLETAEDRGKFSLLDVDTTPIPSNSKGIVLDSLSRTLVTRVPIDRRSDLSAVDDTVFFEGQEDYTVHIEPDWDNDIQCSLIIFRHRGRFVFRASASVIHDSFELWTPGDSAPCEKQGNRCAKHWSLPGATKLAVVEVEEFHGSRIPEMTQQDLAVIIPTVGRPRARICILAMYYMYFGEECHVMQIRHPSELEDVLGRGWRIIMLVE